jgi:formate hydrogenlyase subunit 6/NADH:ubiquinone oxidoreductase subunit I
LRDGECISCLKCTMICPKQNIHYLPKIRKNKKDEKK